MMRAGRYAALDIGTVTCRMLIADVDEAGGISEVRRLYAITNLGEGVDATGELAPAAMERVARAVRSFVAERDALCDTAHPLIAMTAVATSAARDARNAADFSALIRGGGVELAVIPGGREAALSFAGASMGFPGERLLVVDVGGGSTEAVLGRGGGSPERAHSFNVGCRRVTERFLSHEVPTPAELGAARAWVRGELEPWFSELRRAGGAPERAVAVAGTATTVVSVREAMETYDAARVQGAFVSRSDLDAVYERLRALPLVKRRAVAGLDPGRAPVIVAGLLILQEVLVAAGMAGFTASETDILHGLVLDAARTEPPCR